MSFLRGSFKGATCMRGFYLGKKLLPSGFLEGYCLRLRNFQASFEGVVGLRLQGLGSKGSCPGFLLEDLSLSSHNKGTILFTMKSLLWQLK